MMSESKRSRRTAPLLLVALLGVLVVADTLVWSIACQRLDDGVRAAIATSGWSLSADPVRWRGWPVAAEIVLPNATLRSGPDILPPLAWTASTQTLGLNPLHPTRLTISATGPQTIALADAPPVPFTAATLIVTLDLARDFTESDENHLDATDLRIVTPGGPVHIGTTRLDARPDGLALRLSALWLPKSGLPESDAPIDSVSLVARLSPPIVPMLTAIDSARRWRSAAGHLDIDDAALAWGQLAVTGKATLTLDPALQPFLTGHLAATGLLPTLDRLVANGALTASGATAIRGILTILSVPTGTAPVSLPIQLQDGLLTVARIPILRLSPLKWD